MSMSDRPRIGLLSSAGITLDSFFPEIVTHLRELNFVVCLGAGTPTSKIDSTTIPGLTRKPSLANWRARTALRAWVRDNNLSIVVTNTATASALVRCFAQDTPVVYFCHGLHWRKNPGLQGLHWKLIEKMALRRTAGVITLNSEDELWFKFQAPDLKSMRLPFGVGIDLASYPRTPLQRAGKLRLCWIGEFSARKNPAHALQLAVALRANGTSFHLDMLGDGSQHASIEASLRKLGLEQYVTLRGHTPASPYLTNSDALVHTASWEGLPRVFLEALAVGRPIFSYDIKGSRDIPGTHLSSYGDTDGMAANIANYDWNRANAINEYPHPESLSYTAAAEQIARFLGELDHVRVP